MSLETKIEKLTIAIEALTLALGANQPKADEHKADEHKADEHKADEHKADEPKADEPKSQFADVSEFSKAVKELVRAKPEIKGKVKGVLSEYGYKILADVNPTDFDAIHTEVEQL